MRTCTLCRLQVQDSVKFCPSDGNPTADIREIAVGGKNIIVVTNPGQLFAGQFLGILSAIIEGLLGAFFLYGGIATEKWELLLAGIEGDPTLLWIIQGVLTILAAIGGVIGAAAARHSWRGPFILFGVAAATSAASFHLVNIWFIPALLFVIAIKLVSGARRQTKS